MKVERVAAFLVSSKLSLMDKFRIAKFRMARRNTLIQPRKLRFPVHLRNKTDYAVFHNVLYSEDYDVPVDFPVNRIIDAGANIGFSAVYFASVFPKAQVIAVEPAAANFRQLTLNSCRYDNIALEHAALAGASGYLEIANPSATHYAYRLVPSRNADSTSRVPALTIPDLMLKYQWEDIDILKMDIEGGEYDVFTQNAHKWIDRVRVLLIELHDTHTQQCSAAFFRALEALPSGYSVRPSGEILVIKNLKYSQSALSHAH